MSTWFGNLMKDLQRRRVFKAAAIYIAAAWVIVQVIDVVGPYFFGAAADGVMRWVVATASAGFPVAVLLAWCFDITTDGVRRTKPGSAMGMLAIVASTGMLVAGTAAFVWLMPDPAQHDESTEVGVIADSVAVMPFTDLSARKSDSHFTDGIAAVLVHKLSPVSQLTVFAIDSTIRLKDQDPKSIRQKLGAAIVLSGTVQRSGQQFRISTWLIDTRTGKTVWSEQFDRENQDVFAIQDEIALAVAKQLGTTLKADVRDRVTAPLTEDLDAYDLYLSALQELRNTPLDEGLAKGIAFLEAAVEKDPEFALGWSALASAVFWHTSRNYLPRDEGLRLSDEYLQRALELDPELSDAHAHATTRAAIFGDLESARASFEKAIEYGPSNARAYQSLGIALSGARLYPEALQAFAKGLELDPYNPSPWLHFHLGFTHLFMQNYETGMQYLGKSYLLNKGTRLAVQSLEWLAEGAQSAGQYDEAIAAYEIALRDGYESLETRASLARALLVVGDKEAAAEELARAETIRAQRRADNRSMNSEFWRVDDARLYLDLVTSDFQHQLLTAQHFTQLADAGEVDGWEYSYEAMFLNTMLGRHKEAARTADQLIASGVQDSENYAYAAFAHRHIGNEEIARQYLDAGRELANEVMASPHTSPQDLIWVALFRAADEQNDAAIDILQHLYHDRGYRDHLYLWYMPLFDNLRSDPRYIDLIRNMRQDTDQMRERVNVALESGDWESIIARHLVP